MSRLLHYTIGDYLAVLGILLVVLYASWYFMQDRLKPKRQVLWMFYAGVLLLFGAMVYGFLERNGWLFFGAMILHAFWMAWIRKRLGDKGDDSSD